MSLGSNIAKASKVIQLLEPKSAANTGAATGSWIAVPMSEGDLIFTQTTGAITGTLAGAIETATDDQGAGGAALTLDEAAGFTSVSAANKIERRTIGSHKTLGYVRYVGTVGTGPVLVAVSMAYHPKYV